MAVDTQARPEERRPRSTGHGGYHAGRERPAGGWELWTWLFMRISGVVLLVLAVGHILIMHVFDGGVVQDYVRWPAVRFAVNVLFSIITFSLFVLGTVIVFTFDPSKWRPV